MHWRLQFTQKSPLHIIALVQAFTNVIPEEVSVRIGLPCSRWQESGYKDSHGVFGHGGGPAQWVQNLETALRSPQPSGSLRGLPQEGRITLREWQTLVRHGGTTHEQKTHDMSNENRGIFAVTRNSYIDHNRIEGVSEFKIDSSHASNWLQNVAQEQISYGPNTFESESICTVWINITNETDLS